MDISRSPSPAHTAALPASHPVAAQATVPEGFHLQLDGRSYPITPEDSHANQLLSAEQRQLFAQAAIPVSTPTRVADPSGNGSLVHYKARRHAGAVADAQQLMQVVVHLDAQGMPRGLRAHEYNLFAMADGDTGHELLRMSLQPSMASARGTSAATVDHSAGPSAAMPGGTLRPGAARLQGASPQVVQQRARRESFAQARELVEAIRRGIERAEDVESEDGSDTAKDHYDLPELAALAGKPPAVKLAVGTLAIEGDLQLGPILRALKLGPTGPDAKVRQTLLANVPDLQAIKALAGKIDDLNPTAEDIPRLLKTAHTLASRSSNDFVPFIARLYGQVGSEEQGPNPDYLPLRLTAESMQPLVQTWLRHTPPLLGMTTRAALDYPAIDPLLGPGGLLNSGSPRIPSPLPELHAHLQHVHRGHPFVTPWLGFTAAQLLDTRLSSPEQALLGSALVHLSHHADIAYAGSQIVGQTLQDDERRAILGRTLQHFQNPTLGLLVHAAAPKDEALMARFAALVPPGLEQRPDYLAMVRGFAIFASSDAVPEAGKSHALRLFADHLQQAEDPAQACVQMLRTLGVLGQVINQGAQGKLAEAYHAWLPHAQNVAQLQHAAHPNQNVMQAIIQQLIGRDTAATGMLIHTLRRPDDAVYPSATPQTALAPMNIVPKQVYGWAMPHVARWVAEGNPAALLERALNLNGALSPSPLSGEAAFKFSDRHAKTREIAERAEDSDSRDLKRWAELAGLLCHDLANRGPIPDIVDKQLQSQANFHSEHLRPALTLCLHRAVSAPHGAEAFKAFADTFKPAHSQVFAAPLFLLAETPQGAKDLQVLIKAAQGRNVRDTRRAIPLVKLLSEMALAKSLTTAQKRAVLNAVCAQPAVGGGRTKEDVTPAMAHVLALVKIADTDSADKDLALQALRQVAEQGDAAPASHAVAKILYGVADHEADAFQKNYGEFLNHSRSATALSFFASSLYVGTVESPMHSPLQREVASLAKALVANDNGATLKQVRYGIDGRPHNALLQRRAPAAWRHWQEPMTRTDSVHFGPDDLVNQTDPFRYLHDKIVNEFHAEEEQLPLLYSALQGEMSVEDALEELPGNDDSQHKDVERQLLLALTPGLSMAESAKHLEAIDAEIPFRQLAVDIKGLLRKLEPQPLSAEKCRALKVSISDKAEDLFLSGTDVVGSCLNIHADIDTTRGLSAYVLDGKYLSAQITNEAGAIMSRRAIRLMWSEEHEKPVIYVEPEYANPGVPDKLRKALLQLVQEKADRMGALVAIADDDSHADARATTLGTVHAHASGRLYEYVDALEGIQEAQRYRVPNAQPMARIDPVS